MGIGSKKKVKVRLLGIDAPEIKQAFGEESKMILIRLIEKQNVIVVGNNKDRYGRLIGKVLLDDRDINLEMIKAGAAWHYKKYQADQLEADRILYSTMSSWLKKTKEAYGKRVIH
jgi:endonuclease YncB( thermonuclease family)